MPRNIPINIAAALRGGSTTMCAIIKITPVQPGYDPFGITTLDADVTYDDGTGSLLYSAAVGTEPSTMQSTGDLSVSGGETKQLMPVFDTPAEEADIAAGAYDYATFVSYMVDYANLGNGHVIVQTGTLGRNTVTDSGLSWTAELRGLTQVLKQTITEKWSLQCRAVFGSLTATPQSRFPCKFDVSVLWQDATVLHVGTDNTQELTVTGLTPTYGGFPGLVEWLTGNNTGRSDETETFTVGTETISGVVTATQTIGLTFGASYPIQIGDTLRFRDDCPKTPTACKARSNFPNYRGEPTIPVADNGALSVGKIGGTVTTTTGDDTGG